MDDPESSAPVVPHATAPRRAAATKTAYIELSDDNDNDDNDDNDNDNDNDND
jgi:hypothetical protein